MESNGNCEINNHTISVTKTNVNTTTENWQSSFKTMKEKWIHVLKNKISTDIILKVGEEEEEINCHRIVLIMNSPIFESMLSERWKSNSEIISFPEIDPNIFKIILKFLYTQDFEILEPSTEICLSILKLANVYFIPSLREKCLEYFLRTKELLNEENILYIFEEAVKLSETLLESIALKIIGKNTTNILNSMEFLSLSHESLCHFLKAEFLFIPEIELFDAVHRWADTQCCIQHLSTTPENIRLVLKEALHLIRFPIISPDIFATHIVRTGILTLEERVEILTYFSMSHEERKKIDKLINFQTKPRIPYQTLKRFEEIGTESFDYSKNWRNLVFAVDRSIQIESLGFYGAAMGEGENEIKSSTYNVKVNLYENGPHESDWRCNKLCGRTEQIVKTNGSEEIFYVKFPQSVDIVPDKQYVISFTLLGPKTLTGNLIQNTINMECGHLGKITFTFSEAKYKNNRYQVPEICFTLTD